VVVPVVLGSLARIPDACRSRGQARHLHRADARGRSPHGTRSYSLELPHPAVRDILSWTCGFLLCGRSRIRFSQIRASTTGHSGGDLRRRSEQGFRKATWDEALDFTVQKLPEIQERYGKDTVAVYGGARSFKAIHDPTTAVNPAVP
jgi:hypothetical protein